MQKEICEEDQFTDAAQESFPSPDELQAELEGLSERLRCAIIVCDPLHLLNFLWEQALADSAAEKDSGTISTVTANVGFALEYVHAVLASHSLQAAPLSNKDKTLQEVLTLAGRLMDTSITYCGLASRKLPHEEFGALGGELAFRAMHSWIFTRGYRYQGIEDDFFKFILEPHDDTLSSVYGVSSSAIAKGLQHAADASTHWLIPASSSEDELSAGQESPQQDNARSTETNVALFREHYRLADEIDMEVPGPLSIAASRNVAKTSGLPRLLLEDLSFKAGTEKEFFALGPFRGTPLKTMPGRIKPLVEIGEGIYACDSYFLRDSAYRAIQRGLRARKPDYEQEWTDRQTQLTEDAFQKIFSSQLDKAKVYRSFYYKDVATGHWCENDVLILLDDVLLQVEVKGGVLAMSSPTENFHGYVDRIRKLITKAFAQCERFFRYAASADDVPLYEKTKEGYREIGRLRLADYRIALPIGLTIEAFTPISAFSKVLDEITPILGKHPFISMSIDDLFVLSHFLPTSGELFHYLTVRQNLAGQKLAHLYDEVDHLGMYIDKNRFDHFTSLATAGNDTVVLFHSSSNDINRYFADPNWRKIPPLSQTYPKALEAVLAAADAVQRPGFLKADTFIRDLGQARRQNVAAVIEELSASIKEQPFRCGRLLKGTPLLVWMQKTDYIDFTSLHVVEAESLAIAVDSPRCDALLIFVDNEGIPADVSFKSIPVPDKTSPTYAERLSRANGLLDKLAEVDSTRQHAG